MSTLNEFNQSLQLFALLGLLWLLVSRWTNPRDGRSPRQRRGGIVHGLRAALVGAAAWWFERVALAGGAAVEAVVFSWGRRWYPSARRAEYVVGMWLLLGGLSWWIAGPYLRRRWGQS